jgi:hypothetical protein
MALSTIGRKRTLDQIRLEGVTVTALAADPDRSHFAVTYTLEFPRPGHYLTFPAYMGAATNRVFGDYVTTRNPEYFRDDFVFEASKPYTFAVVFDAPRRGADSSRATVNIDVCDGKQTVMVCRTFPVGVERAR